MAPSPQEKLADETRGDFIPRPMESLTDEAVVITGMSGIFPNSDSVNEFMENLYNKVDMVSTENSRWVYDHPELPKHFGKINGMEKFDAQFFRVHYKQACIMEPMSRKLLEHAYGAIYDAGLNPLQLRGKKVGVFIGSTTSESEKIVIYETVQRNGFGITGCNKAMYANRISYWIDGKGPSYALDLAGASSMACLEHAYRNISMGLCDAAIIGGCNFVAHPTASLNVKRAGYLCLDGKTKCFDQNGDGYVRSDAISVLFIQKAKDAKRVYAEVIGSKMNYATKPDPNFLPIREPKEIQEFLEAFYSNVGVAPEDVEYVEANGSGNAVADGNEVEAIGKVFGKQRPVNIGSVTSNMGNSEPASGVCALTKVCLAYHQGALPGNLHLYTPHEAVREGSVRVVQETTPFDRGYVAVNCFSTTGINIHALLKGHFKPKQQNRYRTNLPYLVLVSARTEECLKEIFDIMKKLPLDPEWIGLMHNIHSTDIPGHMGRGYIILDKSDTSASSVSAESASYCDGTLPPVWFVYSGMGSQWPAMGRELMKIPIFAAAIEKCRLVLEPKGVDIVRILTDPDKTIYDNILHSFVGIAAVQIGLTDILKEMGIVPDNIIGHSVGELGCAYAAGSFTAEQMVLAAHARGRVSLDAGFSRGSMAAVGLGYQEVSPLCPPEIQVACHNSAESSTISGPAEAMKTFVAELTSKGIFAKEVPCSNIAYHSKYIASAGPELLRYLSDIIPKPQLRGDKWVSTSVPKDRWDEDAARYSSAEYHTNNLLNPVLFEETAGLIPENALVIEIAPHGLLQAILRRSHATCRHIPLTRRGHKEPVKFLLESIGKLFEANLNPKVDVLYPKIKFPVSTETPMLSNLVKWEHSEDWYFVQFNSRDRKSIISQKAVMSAHDDDFKYFKGHVIDGINIYPESAILVFVWETFAMYKEKKCKDMSVVFKEVKFDGEACITDGNVLTMEVQIQKGNNQFEVSLFETKIASGFIYEATPSDLKQRPIPTSEDNHENIQISSDDIYNIFEMKGSSYKNEFRSIESMNITRDKANIIWNENWSVFLNGMLQLNFLAKDYDGVSKPKYIQNLKIDVDKHNEEVMKNDGKFCKAEYFDTLRVTRCGGVELFNVNLEDKRQQNPGVEVLETQTFVPHLMNGIITMESAMNINLQILSQNTADQEIQILNSIATTKPLISAVLLKSANQSLDNIFKIVSNDLPTISSDIEITKSDLIVMSDVINNEERKRHLFYKMSKKSFVLLIEDNTTIISEKLKYFNIISRFTTQHNTVLLLNKQCDVKDNLTYVQVGSDKEVDWVPKVRNELEKSKHVVIVSSKQPYFKLSGIVKDFKKTYGNRVRLIVVDDETAPPFNPNNEMYAEQLQRQITISVWHKGHWGGYYYIPCPNTAYLHNFKLTSSSSGDIDNLTWVESPPLSTEQNIVRVQYAGLSSRDIQVAVGLLTGDGELAFGMDFSGVDSANNRVFGLIQSGSIASSVEADSALLWPVPQHWSLEDAATVALPYVMAYYCLGVQASLNSSGAILVVGGGHLAHAVLSIGLSLGCRVFAAVPDAISRDLTRRLFPELPESHIGNSGDDSFVEMIAIQTQSKRCDFVINCASGAIREAAMKCVGMLGYFMDTSAIDMKDNQNFGMYHLTEEKSYKAIRLSNIFDPENRQQRKKLQRMLSEGISSGAVRPLPRLALPVTSGVQRAARLIAGRRVPARVLLKMSPAPSVEPRMEFDSVGSYVVICDNNNVGLEVADRLVKKGAKNIVLHLNPQSIGGLLHMKLLSWKKYKANVQVYSEELKTGIDCKNLLMNAQQLGSVKGIFFVPSKSVKVDIQDTNYEKTSAIVEKFDKISSDLCPELRYFVSLAATAPAAAACIESRVRRKLPALCLHYQGTEQLNLESKAFSSKRERQTLSSVLDSLEVCLKLQYTNVRTSRLKKKLVVDVSQKLAEIIGIKNLNDIDENLALQNLCLTEINVEEIRSLLKEFHGFDYTPSTVLKLTVAELRTTFISPPIDGSTGGMLHSWVDADECAASEPLVVMTTRLSSANESEEELDYSEAYLFMIPGFEGHNKIFASICERLKIKALTLQLAPDLDNESIPVIAENMYKNLKKRFELKSNFYLFGYSFGVNVALELAALLESFGHVGVVCCLASSPAALRCQLSTDIGEPSPQLENHLIQHIYKLMAGKNSDQLTRDLSEIADWSDKVDLFIQRLRGAVRYSHQYKRLVLESTYQRIKLAYEYEPDFKLKSRIVLLKGTEVFEDEALNHDYGLSKYTTQPVEVHQLSSAHASTPWDPKVSNIVNQFLEPSLIEEFKTKNLCETYLAPKLKMI